MTIPRDKIALLGWNEGDDLSVDCTGKKIIITRIPKQSAKAGEDSAADAPAGGDADESR